jgi:hypothetical protein
MRRVIALSSLYFSLGVSSLYFFRFPGDAPCSDKWGCAGFLTYLPPMTRQHTRIGDKDQAARQCSNTIAGRIPQVSSILCMYYQPLPHSQSCGAIIGSPTFVGSNLATATSNNHNNETKQDSSLRNFSSISSLCNSPCHGHRRSHWW